MFPMNPTENWLAINIRNQNEAAQKKAAGDLVVYQQHVKEWEAATIQARYNNAPIPQPPAMPTVTEFFDGGGWIDSRVVPNPSAHPPSLPPMPAVTGPNVGIAGTGGSGAAAFDDELMRLVRAIAARLGVQ